MSKLTKSDDVISIPEYYKFIARHKTFTQKEFLEALKDLTNPKTHRQESWFSDGVECQVLSPKQPWKKGRIQICLEFIPDESEIYDQQLIGTADTQTQCDDLNGIRKELEINSQL